jgi:hypothetical protein
MCVASKLEIPLKKMKTSKKRRINDESGKETAKVVELQDSGRATNAFEWLFSLKKYL